MGPRVQVEPREFQEIADREKGLVIKKRRIAFGPYTYVIRSGDYYYYTVLKQELPLPPECTVMEARHVLL